MLELSLLCFAIFLCLLGIGRVNSNDFDLKLTGEILVAVRRVWHHPDNICRSGPAREGDFIYMKKVVN